MYLSEFQYDLPDERIARYPLPDRDQSRLLVFDNGEISHHRFDSLTDHIPGGSLLIFNNTKVIPARAILFKPGGARIELLLLSPVLPTRVVSAAMEVKDSCTWECMIGNKKRWKTGDLLEVKLNLDGEPVTLTATWEDREKNMVTFSWNGSYPFVDIVIAIGKIPLPPYLGRDAENADSENYQTVYATHNGAVAAPTAGLHFTEAVLKRLEEKNISSGFVTLHVGAGTFQPIKTENVREHQMHSEQIVFTRSFIDLLLEQNGKRIAVGTTSLRSLESLYWFGVKCLSGNENFLIEKDYPYEEYNGILPSAEKSLEAVAAFMKRNDLRELFGDTQIFITPGYQFRMVDALVTNFHQPGSTLILLIAAFTGNSWRRIYGEALQNDYRFLSYGDSSLLWYRKEETPPVS
jgi:S-adenosylmethionine:tRNA ribosyltransferase-isomerase